MLLNNTNKKKIFFTQLIVFLLVSFVFAQDKIIPLKFEHPPFTDSDKTRSLQSLIKIQGTGQFCQDGLYLMTHFGDKEEIFQNENQSLIDNPLINRTWRHCSLYSSSNKNSVIMGRNWDNQTVGSIIVSLYYPSQGYSSISFTRSISLGFGHKDLLRHKKSIFGSKLLLAPFYAFDGINEYGLAMGTAGVNQVTIKPKRGKELVYAPFLIRKILDRAKNIDEAVNLIENYIPFDLDKNSLNTHYFLTDATGKSVILEYADDQWKKIYSDKSWQVLTNKPVYAVSDSNLKEKCWRFQSISETLENTFGYVDWKDGMQILQDVTQKGTTWSVTYLLVKKELYFSVYQDWKKVYHIKMPKS